MKRRAPFALLAVAALLTGYAWGSGSRALSHELYFWKGPAYRHDNRVLYQDGHPCGEVVVARVTHMPSLNDPVLRPNLIREVDATGATLERWAVPTDAYPVAVRAEHLLFWVGTDTKLWVGSDGEIASVKPGDPSPNDKPQRCPFRVKGLDENTQLCQVLSDRSNGKQRYIVSNVVCT
jgi:hypothetical protein